MSLIRWSMHSSAYIFNERSVSNNRDGVKHIISQIMLFFNGWPQDVVVFEMIKRMIVKEMNRCGFITREGIITVTEDGEFLEIYVDWFYDDGKDKFPMTYDDKITVRYPKE